MSKFSAAGQQRFEAGKRRREEYLKLRNEGVAHKVALERIGVTHHAYRYWRQHYKDFAAMADAIISPGQPVSSNTKWDAGFAAFRKAFFGMDSTWFHLLIVNALEEAKPGEVTLITIPPEHGKTTLIEDYCSYKLALDPLFRIIVGSEKQAHSKKVLGRIKNRMEEDGPYRPYVHRFGPFRAPTATRRKSNQPWAADHFDVFKKGNYDERDFSMAAAGMGSAIAGSRTDLLIADDPQSQKSLNQTDALFETFRQDWLSRPGSKGRTVVLMTRQGEGDFAEKLMESEILDHHIVIPAWSEEHGWLWPERYSEDEYAIMRRNAGEDAWERNYMQVARPKHTIIFDKPTIAKGRDPQRSILNMQSTVPKPWPVIIGLDPGFNVAGVTAAIDGPKFEIIEARKPRGLSGTEEIIGELEDLVARVHLPGVAKVTDVVIESKAFQRGLLTDERMQAMVRQYGFRIIPHETSDNKYDPDFGVPQMVHSLLREEIVWPWGDEISRRQLSELEADMFRWRPSRSGAKLEQDSLMATWFAWLTWRQRRRNERSQRDTSWDFTPAPTLVIGGSRGTLMGARR